MRRPTSRPLAVAPPAVTVDDVFMARLAALAVASTPSAAAPARPAALKVVAAAASVAVVVTGGAYAADRLQGPAPHHPVRP
ncbi:MAG: hypothetical protein ACXVWZ_09965, partial [Nocardioides sp.]